MSTFNLHPSALRSSVVIKDHITQVSRSLHDSQEHAQIVHLEERLEQLQTELRVAELAEGAAEAYCKEEN